MPTNATEHKNNKIKSNLTKVPSGVEGKDSDSDDFSGDDTGKVDLDKKQQFHIIESIEDLRHIRADLFQIMVEKGEEGHVECSNIIEKAILVKVKIIKRNKKGSSELRNKKLKDYFRKLAEQWLIDGFADLEVEGSSSSVKSPLHYAAEIGSRVLLDALLLPFKFCRYRMANISNNTGQTALFPLLLNLNMTKREGDPEYNKKTEEDSQKRIELLVRLIQVGLSFSHADNSNKNVLHYLRGNLSMESNDSMRDTINKDFHSSSKIRRKPTVDDKKSVEIKYILKHLSALFIRDGKTAIRKQTVAISKSKYTKFHQKLNGLVSSDSTPSKKSGDKIENGIHQFANNTYIYKCFLGTDDDDLNMLDIINNIKSGDDNKHGEYRRNTANDSDIFNDTKAWNDAKTLCRAEKNLCHLLFSDGSLPKYELYFPLTVGKILFFPVKNIKKLDIIHQSVFKMNEKREDLKYLYDMTMRGMEDMWHNYDPYSKLNQRDSVVVKVHAGVQRNGIDAIPNPLYSTHEAGQSNEANNVGRSRSRSFEDDDRLRRVHVSYLTNTKLLQNELSTLINESEYSTLKKIAVQHGLTDYDIDVAEKMFRLADTKYSRNSHGFFAERPDRRTYLTTFIFCKRLGFDPVQTFHKFFASYDEVEPQDEDSKKTNFKEWKENRKNNSFELFKEAIFNQWTRMHSMVIDFFEIGNQRPISRVMSNTQYASYCWGIGRKEIVETREFLVSNVYVKTWDVKNMKIMCEGAYMDTLYVKHRRLIEMYGMLRVIHGRYTLRSIKSEFELFLSGAKFEGLCRNIEMLIPEKLQERGEALFNLKSFEKIKDSINLEYVAYLSLVRERRKMLEVDFFEKKYDKYIAKLKKVFKDSQHGADAISLHEEQFQKSYGKYLAMEKFEMHCFSRYASGPHAINIQYKDCATNKVENITRKRTGMWRAQRLYENKVEDEAKPASQMRQSRSNTASYFLREVVRTALDAGCGNEVCSCVNEIGCNLLEIIEAAPNLTEFFGKESQPTLSLIYQNLLLAASKYANEKKATRLIEVLISKRVNVLRLAQNPLTNPLSFAADRRMLRASSILIKAGATVTVNALEALFNALEGQAYYEKRIAGLLNDEASADKDIQGARAQMVKHSKSFKTRLRESRRTQNSNSLKRTFSKQYVDALFKHNGEDVKSILRKQVLFHGAESGTLTSSILHYMIEDSMSQKRNDFDVCDTDEYGATAMHYASMNGHHRTIMVLAEAGGRNSMNIRDDNLQTKIRDSLFFKTLPFDKVDYLRGYAGINEAYRRRTISSHHYKYRGYTPLALAVQNGHVECVRVLLDLGADPFLRDANKAAPNPHLIDPTCPYWLSLGIRLPMHRSTSTSGENIEQGQANNVTFICALNQKTVRRPRIPTVQGFDEVLQRSHGRRSVMDAHFKGQIDSVLLTEQRSRRKRRTYRKYIRQWYDNVLRDGVRSIVDKRMEEYERSLVNYGTSEGVKHVDATFANQFSANNDVSITSLLTGTTISNTKLKRSQINLLMRKHPAVHLMRSRYGTYRFRIYLVYYFVCLFFPMIFCIFLLNAGEGVNRMRERIENEMVQSNLFTTVNENKENFYVWLKKGLLTKVYSALNQNTYKQVGMPQIEIHRMRDKARRWNSTDNEYQDVKEPYETIIFFSQKNYSYHGWGGLTLQDSHSCWANETMKCAFIPQKDGDSYKFNFTNDYLNETEYLKKNHFLDKYTYSVGIKFVFYSMSTGSYCRTNINIHYYPDKLVEKSISYYVFTTNTNFRRGSTITIRFQHVCLFMFCVIMVNELVALVSSYFWSCRGPCIKIKNEFETKRKGDIFWDKEVEEVEMEEGNYGVSFGKGRGISVINRARKKNADGNFTTPWQRKLNRERRKSAQKFEEKIKNLKMNKRATSRQSVNLQLMSRPSTKTADGRKRLVRSKSTQERGHTSSIEMPSNKGTSRSTSEDIETTWPSSEINMRTKVREHMQAILDKAANALAETHDNQKYQYSVTDMLELWWLRCIVAYKHKNFLQLMYVLVGLTLIVYIGIFMLAVDTFEKEIKNGDVANNFRYFEQIDLAIDLNQSLRLLFIVFTGTLTTKMAQFAKVHPVFGKFTLAIGKVIVSNSITHFLFLYMSFYMITILCYHVMFGDVVYDFRDFTRTAMTLFRLGITGEHEEDTMMPTNSPYMNDAHIYLIPRALMFGFMLLTILFAMNLFIAILTAEWSKHVDADLWGSEIDNELCRHVEYNHAGLIFESNPVLGCFLRIWRDQYIQLPLICGSKRIYLNCCFIKQIKKRVEEIELREESKKISPNERSLRMDRASRYSRLRAISFSDSA